MPPASSSPVATLLRWMSSGAACASPTGLNLETRRSLMMGLAPYAHRPSRLEDFLPWGLLVAPGVILNKDGSFQRCASFRGPDVRSSTPEELSAFAARANNVFKR